MIKKIITIFIFVIFTFTSIGGSFPRTVEAATAKTTTTKKSTTKKTTKKKVIKKKKERLILNPPLITLDTAPHSPKPVTKKKTTTKKKVTTKKKANA